MKTAVTIGVVFFAAVVAAAPVADEVAVGLQDQDVAESVYYGYPSYQHYREDNPGLMC